MRSKGQAIIRRAVFREMILSSLVLLKKLAMTGLAVSPIIAVIAAAIYLPISATFFAGGPAYPVRVELIELPDVWPTPPADVFAQVRPNHLDATDSDLALAQQLPIPTEELAVAPTAAMPQDAAPAAGQGLATSTDNPGIPAAKGIMPVNFNIAGPTDFDATLQVSKTVIFNERSLGQLTVRIDEGARVYVSTAEMSGLFPEGLRPPRSWQEFVPLRQVREAGIDLRYDPTADQLVLRDSLSN